MSFITDQLKKSIFDVTRKAYPEANIKLEDITLEHPAVEEYGDYSTNIALKLKLGNPKEVAEKISADLTNSTVISPGFINFKIPDKSLVSQMVGALAEKDRYGQNSSLKGKKMMVEFAHPNTHKEMHIGHMRTMITGEALSRILDASGAIVFRANYQGDIGPHVAKALWGIRNLDLKGAEKLTLAEKAHLLGKGYIEGNKDYEEHKEEIDGLNKKLYLKDPSVMAVYSQTRKWSLDYYDSLYARFYTKFDKLYFESEVFESGKNIVLDNVGKVFEKSEGAIVFPGGKYGLHTRVFITKDGNPTYEGKDMALAPMQFNDFPFDKCIHVVANEQAGYFQVVIKALELLDPNFVGREYHLSMGMVQLVGKKISSRTGVIITVDGLLDDVRNLLKNLTKDEESLEPTTIGAVKYSVLKTAPVMNSTFDLEKSVSLDGDSGPYIQYTYARAKSVLRKSDKLLNGSIVNNLTVQQFNNEELAILRYLYRFPEVVEAAAKNYSPNLVCSYLFETAKRFNNLYNNCPILENEFRLAITQAVSIVLKNGLNLLGIQALEKM